MYSGRIVKICVNLEAECVIFWTLIIKHVLKQGHIVVENKMLGTDGITDFKRGRRLEETGKRSGSI